MLYNSKLGGKQFVVGGDINAHHVSWGFLSDFLLSVFDSPPIGALVHRPQQVVSMTVVMFIQPEKDKQ